MFETEQFKKEICSPKGVFCRTFCLKGMGKMGGGGLKTI